MAKSAQCCLCGQSGKRACPAKGGLICTTCCGSKRGTQIDCPPDCTSFPFGTKAYDLWLKVDGSWQRKALEYVVSKIGKERLERTARTIFQSWAEEKEEVFLEALPMAILFHLIMPDEDGTRPLGEQWAADKWIGLNNDECYMMRYRVHALPGILEIQNVLDDTRIECIDLLDRDRAKFIVFDRSTASRANRFDTIVVWLVHYPHFCRVDGSGVHLKRNLMEPFLKEMRKCSKASLKDNSDWAVKRYLASHFGESLEFIAQLGREMHDRILSSLDANHCRAFYKIRGQKEDIVAILESKPDFEADNNRELQEDDPPDSRYYSWLRRGDAKVLERRMPAVFRHNTPEDGVGGLGLVRLSSNELMLETFSRQKFDFAKKLLKKYFGNNLALLKEEIVNLAQRAFERSQDPTRERKQPPKSTIPPEVEKQLIEQFHRRHYEKFLDDTIPMLNGLTPRQAAADLKMRAKLIDLMKLHMQGLESQSRERGFELNIDWVLKELGLHELM